LKKKKNLPHLLKTKKKKVAYFLKVHFFLLIPFVESESDAASVSVSDNEDKQSKSESDSDEKESDKSKAESPDDEDNASDSKYDASDKSKEETDPIKASENEDNDVEKSYPELKERVKVFRNIAQELDDLEEILKKKFQYFQSENSETAISERFTRR